MREILFRGKMTDNGEWVEGVFSPYNWNLFGEREEKPQIIIFSENEDFDGLWCEVLPETVGQFTGRTDKNRKMIFEGDICRFKSFNDVFIGRNRRCTRCKTQNAVGLFFYCIGKKLCGFNADFISGF